MKKIFNKYILSKKEYNLLKHKDDLIIEFKKIIKNTEIEKERLNLEKKYKKYIGNWYLFDGGIIFQIKRIKYVDNYSYLYSFCFDCFIPNNEDWVDINIHQIIDGEIEEISKDKVSELLGL